MQQILSLFFINTLIGGAFTLLHLQKKVPFLKRRILSKFIYFFLINLSIIFSVIFNNNIFRLIFVSLTCIAFYELSKNQTQCKKFFISSILIFLFIAFISINYIFTAQTLEILLLYCFCISFDGFSQAIGQSLGRLKLAPDISPNKTIEGSLGGLFFVFINYWILFPSKFNLKSISILSIIVLACLSGDLLASFYKRKVNIKDFSNLIPFHGGVLDRFDSFFMAIFSAGVLSLFGYGL